MITQEHTCLVLRMPVKRMSALLLLPLVEPDMSSLFVLVDVASMRCVPLPLS